MFGLGICPVFSDLHLAPTSKTFTDDDIDLLLNGDLLMKMVESGAADCKSRAYFKSFLRTLSRRTFYPIPKIFAQTCQPILISHVGRHCGCNTGKYNSCIGVTVIPEQCSNSGTCALHFLLCLAWAYAPHF